MCWTGASQDTTGCYASVAPESGDQPFSADSIGQLVSTTLKRIAGDFAVDLDPDERATLVETSTHALRHTFGTLFVANNVPLDVVQRVMGHESLETTTIYVQAEKRRAIEEIGKYFEKWPSDR